MIRLIARTSRIAFGVKYSRFYLEDLARDRVAEQRVIEQQQERVRLQNIYNLPANDANPKNRISVRMNHGVFKIDPKKQYRKESCWVMEPKPVEIMPKRIISATRKYIITSIKKAKTALLPLKKLHILDAIHVLQMSQKKVARLMVRTFYNLIDHAKHRDYNIMRLWVHGCLIGKTKRYRSTRYHAKGQGHRQKRDFCGVKIVLYQKPQKQYFQEIAVGQCAPGVANIVRSVLKKESDYKMMSSFTGITTSRGRQQAKLLFKRKVDRIMIQNEQQGKYQPRKLVQKNLREQQGQRMKEQFKLFEKDDYSSSIKLRERIFKKNLGL